MLLLFLYIYVYIDRYIYIYIDTWFWNHLSISPDCSYETDSQNAKWKLILAKIFM